MAGFENTIVFSNGEKLQPSSANDISRMQELSTDISRINFVGNPNGSVSSNPGSLCHDPVSGNIYFKQTGISTTGWLLIGQAVLTANSTPQVINGVLDFGLTNLGIGSSFPNITTGIDNAGFGVTVLSSVTSGSANTGYGKGSLDYLQTGNSNTGMGTETLSNLVNGSSSTAVGYQALFNFLGPNEACAFGAGALGNSQSGDNNSAFGYLCLNALVGSASQNSAFGYEAAFALQSGEQNCTFGALTFATAVSTMNCSSFGYQALNSCTGDGNSAFGRASLVHVQSGTNNSGFGLNSLFGLTLGSNNTCGGANSLSQILTGSDNIAYGNLSGSEHTLADSSNIDIGNLGVVGDSNTTRIGSQGTGAGQQNRCFIAGITGATVVGAAVLCDTNGQLGTISSSERYKENIKNIEENVSVLNLNPVEFNYKINDSKTKQYGLIAEEVHKEFPYLCLYNDKQEPETVKYHELPVFLLNEIKKLKKEIEDIKISISKV